MCTQLELAMLVLVENEFHDVMKVIYEISYSFIILGWANHLCYGECFKGGL